MACYIMRVVWILAWFVCTNISAGYLNELLIGDNSGYAYVGTTLKGSCHIDDSKVLSETDFDLSQLIIRNHHGKTIRGLPVSNDTISFEIKNVTLKDYGAYTCWYNFSGDDRHRYLVKQADIDVVDKPLPPELHPDSILIDNWESMTLTVYPSLQEQDQHTHNTSDNTIDKNLKEKVATSCKISYMPMCDYKTIWPCTSVYKDGFCQCTTNGQHPYLELSKPTDMEYYVCFNITMSNSFGSSHGFFRKNVLPRVKPNLVPDFSIYLLNDSHSLRINWTKPSFRRNFNYTVTLTATNFKHQVKRVRYTENLLVKNLIPHGQYEVKITAIPMPTGLENDPVVKKITMPSDVPGENPQIIGMEMIGSTQRRRVVVYWREIPEIKRNGPIKIQVVIANKEYKSVAGDQSSCSLRLETSESCIEVHFEAVSTNSSIGKNTSMTPSKVVITKDSEPSFSKVIAERVKDKSHIIVTWKLLEKYSPSHLGNARIVYCNKGNMENGRCDQTVPLRFVPVSLRSNLRIRSDEEIFRVGMVKDTKDGPGLIKWSKCIYQQGAGFSEAPNFNLVSDKKKLGVKFNGYPCDKTKARVRRVSGTMCRIASKSSEKCVGQIRNISMEESQINELQTYEVDQSGYYTVSLAAVSDSSSSPVAKSSLFVPDDLNQVEETTSIIVGVSVAACAIIILIIVVWLVVRCRQMHKIPVRMVRPPTADLVTDDEQTHDVDELLVVNNCNQSNSIIALNCPERREKENILRPASLTDEESGNTESFEADPLRSPYFQKPVVLNIEYSRATTTSLGKDSRDATASLGEDSRDSTASLGEDSRDSIASLGEDSRDATASIVEDSGATTASIVEDSRDTTASLVEDSRDSTTSHVDEDPRGALDSFVDDSGDDTGPSGGNYATVSIKMKKIHQFPMNFFNTGSGGSTSTSSGSGYKGECFSPDHFVGGNSGSSANASGKHFIAEALRGSCYSDDYMPTNSCHGGACDTNADLDHQISDLAHVTSDTCDQCSDSSQGYSDQSDTPLNVGNHSATNQHHSDSQDTNSAILSQDRGVSQHDSEDMSRKIPASKVQDKECQEMCAMGGYAKMTLADTLLAEFPPLMDEFSF